MPEQSSTVPPAPDLKKTARDYFADMPKPRPEETVFEWISVSRPFKQRNRRYYVTIALIVFLISLILFFAGQFLPIAVVIAVAFLAYVLSSVPPHESQNRITTYGIRIDDQIYYWEELGRFWIDEKYSNRVVNIELGRFPNRVTIPLGEIENQVIEEILAEVLLKERPPLTSFEKASRWLSEKIPLEG